VNGPPLLEIEGLRTYFYARSRKAFVRSVDGVTIDIARGQTLGVVGESGCGKSVTALSIMGLVTAGPGVISGTITLRTDGGDRNLLDGLERYVRVGERNGRIAQISKDEAGWRDQVDRTMAEVRGKRIAMIFQNPRAALNPFVTVGRQIAEVIRLHTRITDPKEAKERAIDWLERVRMDSPRLRFDNHPYGLSGGMCQRAMIAMALASEPSLLIADEPTTGLDATIQAKIVELLAELKADSAIAMLLISHDIRVVSRLSDRVAVMYGGTVVEHGPADAVLDGHIGRRHPYTEALLASVPDARNGRGGRTFHAIEGDVLDTIDVPAGCRFYPRCNRVTERVRDRCAHEEPGLTELASGHRVRCWLYADERP
jgi:oligopeptide/dipeptide ABC transporter ATP-binding protein